MWSVEEVSAAIVEHGSPTRRGWWNAEAQEAQCGFRKDRSAQTNSRLHQHRRDDVWPDVHDNQAGIADTHGAGSLHVVAFARPQHLAAYKARIADPSTNR